ncbi:MAG: penicillin-binding protein activator [Candidatus Pacebacteria bacterium]|nr:penicillin-binding protein activator [Candidatus Paceibacterota bacterium]
MIPIKNTLTRRLVYCLSMLLLTLSMSACAYNSIGNGSNSNPIRLPAEVLPPEAIANPTAQSKASPSKAVKLAQTGNEEVAPPPTSTAAPPPTTPPPAAATRVVNPDKRVKIALLLPLSGKDSFIGRAMLNAAILAVFDFGDQRLVLQSYDTEGEGGVKAATRRALSEDVSLILGPLFGRQVAEVAELAARRNINVISFSNDISVAGENAFVFGISPTESLGRVLDYAASKSITSYAALLSDDPFGRRISEILKSQLANVKSNLIRIDYYRPTETNFTEAVQAVAEFDERRKGVAAMLKNQALDPLAPPLPARSKDAIKRAQKLTTTREVSYQALVLSESGQRLRNLASLIPYYDINTLKVKIIGLNSNFDDRNLLTEPALNGAWFAAPDPAGRREFEKKYAAAFGSEPPRLTSLGYDLVGLAAVLTRRGEAGEFTATSLRSRDGFSGIDGIFRFTVNNSTERGLAVMEIQPRGAVVISKAAVKFSN